MQAKIRNSVSCWLRRAAPAVVLAVGAVLPLRAQQPQPPAAAPPAALTPEVRRAVVDSLAAYVARFYAVAEDGRRIADGIQRRQREGAYAGLTHPVHLAEALTADLRKIGQDRHLRVGPPIPGPPLYPMGTEVLPKMDPAAPPSASPEAIAAARRRNFDIGRVEVLPGNVGYLELRRFPGFQEANEAIAAALRLLEHTDALILDVREHSGGAGYTTNFLVSHFTGSEPLHTLDITVRAANQVQKSYTMAEVPGPRRPEVPLYVLTSRSTVSGGEGVAFVLKNLGRATIVGDTTAGAGRGVRSFDLGQGLAALISVTTAKEPRSGAEWERVGVTPHVAVPPRAALAVAHAHALQKLAAGASNPALRRELELTRERVEARERELELTRERVEARERPLEVAPATLQRYVGVYGGERTITVENGRLIYRRMPSHRGDELVPLSETLFVLGPWRLAFEPGAGEGMRLRISPPDGASLVLDRTGPPPATPARYR
jgi:hypothetical protein